MPESFSVQNREDEALRAGAQRGGRILAAKIGAAFGIGLVVTGVCVVVATWMNSPASSTTTTTVVATNLMTTTTTTLMTSKTTTTTLMTSTTTTTMKVPGPYPAPDHPVALLKGIGYAPVPLKQAGLTVPNDDFFSDHTAALWGELGRGDLVIIKKLGANAVRLYGNDPRYSHAEFFDAADALGIGVIAGISDYPFTQAPDACVLHQGANCFNNIKSQYMSMLQAGQFLVDGTTEYDDVLKQVILINEPELKTPAGIHDVKTWSKAVISAFDGALEAEKALGVTKRLPVFTATFSYAVCGQACDGKYGHKPGLGMMVALQKAMVNPASVGYTAKNDLSKAYQERFVNSYNTANPARDIKPQFLDAYQEYFGFKDVYIGEFHPPGWNTLHQMTEVMAIASDKKNPLRGVTFFEFQVRYDKGGSEMEFGMFGLGDEVVGHVTLGDQNQKFDVSCLTEVKGKQDKLVISSAVAVAYKGKGVEKWELCPEVVV